jgi:hypothetical protein
VNWTPVLPLSFFGLAIGIATVFVIPSSVEPLFWLVIFATSPALLFDRYVANHAQEAAMMRSRPGSPRLLMGLMGPVIGVVSGLVLGLFTVVARQRVGGPPSPSAVCM